jgi:hypothetical protein
MGQRIIQCHLRFILLIIIFICLSISLIYVIFSFISHQIYKSGQHLIFNHFHLTFMILIFMFSFSFSLFINLNFIEESLMGRIFNYGFYRMNDRLTLQ